MSGAGQLTLNIETEQSTYYGFEVFILDASDNILSSVLCDSRDCVDGYDLTAGVKSSGTYYVAVRSESAYGTPEGSYTLRLSYSAGGTDGIELEPNDSKSVSQSLSLNTPLEGTISASDDVDWYALM